MDTSTFNLSDHVQDTDLFDSRELIDSAVDAQNIIDDAQEDPSAHDPDDVAEAQVTVAAVSAIEDEAGSDWPYGQTFIAEHYWPEYVRQFAEDIGAVKGDESWPYTCIDWDQAGRELAMDYSSVEIDGRTYYTR